MKAKIFFLTAFCSVVRLAAATEVLTSQKHEKW